MIDESAIARRRTLPPQAQWGEWRAGDGWPLRTVFWPAHVAEGKGSILFLGGRADFIEKYAESYWTWLGWGLGIATFDWRGQGLSGRLGGDPHKGHIEDFAYWLDDLAGLIDWLRATLPGPYFIVAHSMGAHLALRQLTREATSIDRAVLLAPMLGINTAPLTVGLARRLADWATARGQGLSYGPGQGPYRAAMRGARRQGLLTSDIERFADEGWWIDGNAGLALGGVTFGWLKSAYRSMAALSEPGVLEAVETPVLILVGERERLVDAHAAATAAARLPHAYFEIVADGCHELLRETDTVREATHAHIRRFLLDAP